LAAGVVGVERDPDPWASAASISGASASVLTEDRQPVTPTSIRLSSSDTCSSAFGPWADHHRVYAQVSSRLVDTLFDLGRELVRYVVVRYGKPTSHRWQLLGDAISQLELAICRETDWAGNSATAIRQSRVKQEYLCASSWSNLLHISINEGHYVAESVYTGSPRLAPFRAKRPI
jgi:hypothetical protein